MIQNWCFTTNNINKGKINILVLITCHQFSESHSKEQRGIKFTTFFKPTGFSLLVRMLQPDDTHFH